MKILMLLLFIAVLIQQITIEELISDIKILKNNEEILRQGINHLNKK